MQSPTLVREVVGASHGKMARLKELVDAQPSLSKAAWDWGFGDWESALGAASHVGNREIAEYLISKGAVPTIFSATMLGQVEVVKAMVTASPGIQRISGPHSISLLDHAKNGGAAAKPVLEFLESLGDAGVPPRPAISIEEMKELVGSYEFGSGPTERIEIALAGKGLSFMRKGTDARGLIYKGEQVFHPAGSSAVQVRFVKSGGGLTLTVHSPELVLTARKL